MSGLPPHAQPWHRRAPQLAASPRPPSTRGARHRHAVCAAGAHAPAPPLSRRCAQGCATPRDRSSAPEIAMAAGLILIVRLDFQAQWRIQRRAMARGRRPQDRKCSAHFALRGRLRRRTYQLPPAGLSPPIAFEPTFIGRGQEGGRPDNSSARSGRMLPLQPQHWECAKSAARQYELRRTGVSKPSPWNLRSAPSDTSGDRCASAPPRT